MKRASATRATPVSHAMLSVRAKDTVTTTLTNAFVTGMLATLGWVTDANTEVGIYLENRAVVILLLKRSYCKTILAYPLTLALREHFYFCFRHTMLLYCFIFSIKSTMFKQTVVLSLM